MILDLAVAEGPYRAAPLDGVPGTEIAWIPGATTQTPIMRRRAYDDIGIGDAPAHRTTIVDFTWQGSDWVRGVATTADYPADRSIPWLCSRFGCREWPDLR